VLVVAVGLGAGSWDLLTASSRRRLNRWALMPNFCCHSAKSCFTVKRVSFRSEVALGAGPWQFLAASPRRCLNRCALMPNFSCHSKKFCFTVKRISFRLAAAVSDCSGVVLYDRIRTSPPPHRKEQSPFQISSDTLSLRSDENADGDE
jgi:hypothetical protein